LWASIFKSSDTFCGSIPVAFRVYLKTIPGEESACCCQESH
jgi:hypothetical protein